MRLRSLVCAVCLLLSMARSAFPAPPTEAPGASLAFISQDPVVKQARDLMGAGQFAQAERMLSQPQPGAAAADMRARGELLDILRRTRFEYSLDAAGLLRNVQTSVPDATPEEVANWAKESKARFRVIDGKKYFFRREAQNIFLFSETAKRRRQQAGKAPAAPAWRLTNHLAAIVQEAERTGSIEVVPVRHRFTHTLTIQTNHPAIKPGAVVRVWLPYPQEHRQQREVKLLSASPAPKLIAPNGIDGCPVTGAPQRTIYFEQTVTNPAQPLVFQEVLEFVTYAYYPNPEEQRVEPLPQNWNHAYLEERPPHIVFTPEMRQQLATIVGTETNALAKARRIFRWVSANIPWNAEDEYCVIPSLALRGFNARRGDCGVQNTVFITLCRMAGIPARWQSGFETKPVEDDWGMHDWAEIYIAPWGWLPADASYGVQKSTDPRIADFYCGHQDSYRLIVNLDWGRELFPPKTSLRSEPADFQRGEVEVDGKNLYYDEWETRTEVVREPLTTSRSQP